MASPRRTRVFLCYSRSDARWLERLRVHLRPLERQDLIEAWDDSSIDAGEDRRAAIVRSLDQAGAAVVLVSADWMASDFIQDVELPRLLERAAAGGVAVLPLVVRPCPLELSPLAVLAPVNPPGRALAVLPEAEAEAVLVEAARAVLAAIGRPAAPAAPTAERDEARAKRQLVDLLARRFRQSERESLLFRLDLDPEDVKLRPESREEFARAMVLHVEHRGRLAELWDEVERERGALLRGQPNPFR